MATSGIPPREPLFNGSICRFAGAWGEAAFAMAMRPGYATDEHLPLEARLCPITQSPLLCGGDCCAFAVAMRPVWVCGERLPLEARVCHNLTVYIAV